MYTYIYIEKYICMYIYTGCGLTHIYIYTCISVFDVVPVHPRMKIRRMPC